MPNFSPTLPVDRSVFIDKVTQLFGMKDDTELREVALIFLDDSIKDLNSYLFEFNRRILSGIVLTSGTADYVLQGTPYKEVQAYLVDSTNNRKQPPMHYIPWVQFGRLFPTYSTTSAENTGIPSVYSFRNIEEDGRVTLYPIPDSSTATNNTLTVEYYTRIPTLSSLPGDDSVLQVPQEVETALVYAAQKRLCIHINGPAHPDVAAFDALEQRALSRLIAIDRYHPDSNTRFRIAGHDRRGQQYPGDLYIKI